MNNAKSEMQRMREILMADLERLQANEEVDLERSKVLSNHVKTMVEVGKLELDYIKEIGMQGSLQNSMIAPKKLGDGK
jgi:uncharacterized protein related to proFAR isomerase